jgi:hypothetical protein
MQNAHAMAQRWLCHICSAKEAVIQADRYIGKRPQGSADLPAAGRLRPALQGFPAKHRQEWRGELASTRPKSPPQKADATTALEKPSCESTRTRRVRRR